MRKQREVAGRRFQPLRGLAAVLVVLGIALGEEACFSQDDLAGPPADAPSFEIADVAEPVTSMTVRTLMGPDKRFNEISEGVPEFGGYWMDEQGNMVVALTDLSKRTAVANLTSTELRDKIRGTSGTIRYVEVSRPFRQLLGWRERILGRLVARGDVTLLDIDQTINKLFIGVETKAAISGVRNLADTLRIPADAISVAVMARAQPDIGISDDNAMPHNHMLGDHFPQTLGGIRVRLSTAWNLPCSLGLGVEIGSNQRYITSSHCSDFATLETDLALHQPSSSASDRIGYEVEDPESTCLWESPHNDDNTLCRWADVALYSDDAPGNSRFKRGWAATTEGTTGTAARRHNHANGDSVYTMNSEGGEVSGQFVIKVGARTGRKHGRLRRDCVDILGWVETYTLRCQNLADYERANGDSGGPVFSSDGAFFGIHTGTTVFEGNNRAVYSPIANIEADLGSLNTEGEEHLAYRIPVHVYRAAVEEGQP